MSRTRRLSEIAADTNMAMLTGTMPPPPPESSEATRAFDSDFEDARRGGPDREPIAIPSEFNTEFRDDSPDETFSSDASTDVEKLKVSTDQTGPLSYTVNADGIVGNVERLPGEPEPPDSSQTQAPLPITTGQVQKRVQLTLVPGNVFNPRKCKLCDAKCPPHPAVLLIGTALGEVTCVLCARCDEAVSMLASLIGAGETTLRITSLGMGGVTQTSMLGELERAVPSADDDADGPPSEEVAARIRAIAAELPDSPYDQGAAAFCEGFPVETNPYPADGGPLDVDRHTRWNDGWIQAKADALLAAGEEEAEGGEEEADSDAQEPDEEEPVAEGEWVNHDGEIQGRQTADVGGA